MTAEHVTNFLSGYFHEDWPAEAETDADIVDLFIGSSTEEAREQLVNQLEAVALVHESESSETWLLEQYGCYYVPTDDGLSGSAWLRRIAALLRG